MAAAGPAEENDTAELEEVVTNLKEQRDAVCVSLLVWLPSV